MVFQPRVTSHSDPRGNGRRRVALVARAWMMRAAVAAAVALVLACTPDSEPESSEGSDVGNAPIDTSTSDDHAEPQEPGSDEHAPTDVDQEPSQADNGLSIPQDDSTTDDLDPDLTVDLVLVEVASMSEPIAGAVGPDGVLYLAERAGTVHPLTGEGLGDAVIDIAEQTSTDAERGLLGLAFAPSGDELYLSSTDRDGDTHIRGVAIREGEIRDDEQREIFALEQPQSNHNGGDIAVGPDGRLYIALGDGGGADDPLAAGQDRSTALGSLLRIDPEGDDPYAVPDDNPFVGQDGVVAELFAYGLRNPWRFSFDRATDALWIADVGQRGREEINRVTLDVASGANFGWNLMEGTAEFTGSAPDGHIPPVYEYATGGDEGCAIVGGYVYRGAAIEALVGVYLYADYCVGTIRGLHVDPDGRVVDQADLGVDAGGVLSFAEDDDGELYVLSTGGGVFRIEPAG